MLDQAAREHLSNVLRPVSPPRELEDVYTPDQHARLLDVVRHLSSIPARTLAPRAWTD